MARKRMGSGNRCLRQRSAPRRSARAIAGLDPPTPANSPCVAALRRGRENAETSRGAPISRARRYGEYWANLVHAPAGSDHHGKLAEHFRPAGMLPDAGVAQQIHEQFAAVCERSSRAPRAGTIRCSSRVVPFPRATGCGQGDRPSPQSTRVGIAPWAMDPHSAGPMRSKAHPKFAHLLRQRSLPISRPGRARVRLGRARRQSIAVP